jgi:hypothetical protein
MRDIRPDLQERIEEIDRELARFDLRAVALKQKRTRYIEMLDAESERWNSINGTNGTVQGDSSVNGATNGSRPKASGRTPLSQLVLDVLSDLQTHSEREVAEQGVARGFPFGTKNPLSVVHFAMIGMGQNKVIANVGKAEWRLPVDTA